MVEPDLVATRDGVLVIRHENEISGTTDVADRPEYADRKTVKIVDNQPLDGWFVEDFTWDELRALRCRERLASLRPEAAAFDGQFEILRLTDLLRLID
jgi:glycerophosphoryl diester phosphodiesterase